MRTLVLYFITLSYSISANSQVTVTLRIEEAVINGGIIYVSLFNSEANYKAREVYHSFSLNADNITLTTELSLPCGEYLISIYQDGNSNGKLDNNLVGIPRERFGFSNYDGRSAPGGFQKHKVKITDINNEVVINLYKI